MLLRLARHNSLAALRRDPLYQARAAEIWRQLDTLTHYSDAPAAAPRDGVAAPRRRLRAVAWNIERGVHLDNIVAALRDHPLMAGADLYLLTELDVGMARSGNRDVPREIAARLRLNGVFGPCYLNLAKGGGIERDALGDNARALHGNALYSRWPIETAALLRLPNGKDKMRGQEKRIGSQAAVIATVRTPFGPIAAASCHLDAHSTRRHRRRQLRRVVDALDCASPAPGAALVGGDWNTSTHQTHRAASAIIGFWVRVALGVGRCLRDHYPFPDRMFERPLFRMLEQRGYDYRALNEPGGTTLAHHILNEKDRRNLRDWVPAWCLAHIERELAPFDGVCRLKLDWFAGRGLRAAAGPGAVRPQVVRDVTPAGTRLSDHDPIVLDFEICDMSA
ncbi:MAG: hypothetical protein U1A27_07830 [Phycisphaerae bacterium]